MGAVVIIHKRGIANILSVRYVYHNLWSNGSNRDFLACIAYCIVYLAYFKQSRDNLICHLANVKLYFKISKCSHVYANDKQCR